MLLYLEEAEEAEAEAEAEAAEAEAEADEELGEDADVEFNQALCAGRERARDRGMGHRWWCRRCGRGCPVHHDRRRRIAWYHRARRCD